MVSSYPEGSNHSVAVLFCYFIYAVRVTYNDIIETDTTLIIMWLIHVGGWDGSNRLETAERYDPSTQKWRRIASMSTQRNSVDFGVLNGLLYAVNFEDEKQRRNGIIFMFV